MASVKEELNNIFESLNDFTNLGHQYGFEEDLARVPKLQLAQQITETFVTKDTKKKQDLIIWLRENVEARLVITAKKPAGTIQDWDEFVPFKRRYQNLLRNLLRQLREFGRTQKWLDATELVNSINKINLEETWGRGRKASAVLAALRKVV